MSTEILIRSSRRLAISLLTLLLTVTVGAQPSQRASAQPEDRFILFFPDAPPTGASTDIVEFRARAASLSDRSLTGHAFVALGKRFADGSTYFYSVSGYYPDTSGTALQTLKNSLYGPGRVEYKLADMKNDRIYQTDISSAQARMIKHIIKNFPDKNYALLGNSCGDMMKNVATAIGLSYMSSDLFPTSIVDSIEKMNPPGRPAEKALRDKREGAEIIRGLDIERTQAIFGGVRIDQSRPVTIPFSVPIRPLPEPSTTMTPSDLKDGK